MVTILYMDQLKRVRRVKWRILRWQALSQIF